jgi:hypothetical protein
MATTTNYGWTTPNDTDLVKDGAAAIRTLGSSVDTTTKALNPSTTLGDIEYRSATANTNTRLGIGTTGQVLTVAEGVPTWATSDDANAIQNALLTTTGDTIYASGASTPARLGIGSTGNVLTVAGGVPTWAAPAGGGGMTQIGSTTTLSGSSTTISSLDFTGYNYAYIFIEGIIGGSPSVRLNNISTTDYGIYINGVWGTGGTEQRNNYNRIPMDWSGVVGVKTTGGKNIYSIVITNPTSTLMKNFQLSGSFEGDSSADFVSFFQQGNARGVSSAITSLVFSTGGSFTAGQVKVFGVK